MADISGFQNLLIRGTNWIGDSVMSLAAIRELRRHNPQATVTLMVRPWVRGLFTGQGLVDEILTEPGHGTAISRVLWLARQGKRFDAAVLFPNSFASALTVLAARIPERIGYRRDGRGLLLTRAALPRLESRHQIYYYLDLLFQTGLAPIDYLHDGSFQPDIRLLVPAQARETARHLMQQTGVDTGKPRVVLNPGAFFGPAKRWFTDRYGELALRLVREQSAEVVVIGSSDELRLAREIAELAGTGVHILTGRTDLSTLLGVLGGCDLLITNDSGPMHLAAALGVPQIALFGSTDEVATGPFSPAATVIHKHVECSPCLHRECPIDLRCFDRITVDEVFDLAAVALSKSSKRPSRTTRRGFAAQRAIFLDRDGTLIEEREYLTKQQVSIIKGSASAIGRLNQKGWPVLVITNQSVVSRGLLTEDALEDVHNHLGRTLEEQGARVDAFYFCPHHPDFGPACECRKPAAGLLLRAAQDLGLELSRCFMIGDKLDDVRAGRAAGCSTVLVRTGCGKHSEEELENDGRAKPDHVADDLAAAVQWILEQGD